MHPLTTLVTALTNDLANRDLPEGARLRLMALAAAVNAPVPAGSRLATTEEAPTALRLVA